MLWEKRFAKKMSAAMESFNNSLSTDIRLLPYEIRIDLAYSKELLRIGILKKPEQKKLALALRSILRKYEEQRFFKLPKDEDVHSLVERRLFELAGAAGHKIHTGRSRNEMVITEVKMLLKDELKNICRLCSELIGSIVRLAERNLDAAMPGYTHLQHAQPILFSHYLCSLGFALARDIKKIREILSSGLEELPLGSGAIAGTAFPVNRLRLARELGFGRISQNSIDAISQRDELLMASAALSLLMVHLSRYAEDMIIWSSPEFGFIELDESVSTGSSMMPQKKNPDSLELIRGKSATVIGNMNTLFVLMKGLPLTYARDMQEDKTPIFAALEQAKSSLSVFKEVLSTLRVNKEKMLASIEWELFATDLADYLAKKGLPFRDCHGVVAGLVRDLRNKKIKNVSIKELQKHSKLFGPDAIKCLNIANSLLLRNNIGGTAISSVKKQLRSLKISDLK